MWCQTEGEQDGDGDAPILTIVIVKWAPVALGVTNTAPVALRLREGESETCQRARGTELWQPHQPKRPAYTRLSGVMSAWSAKYPLRVKPGSAVAARTSAGEAQDAQAGVRG